jgi:hypothetical protein
MAAGVGLAVLTILGAVVYALVPGGSPTDRTSSSASATEGPTYAGPTWVEPTYTPDPTYVEPTYTPEPTFTPEPTEPSPTVPPGYRTVDAPGGLTVAVPARWSVAPSSEINMQADDPDADCLVRFGGSPADADPLDQVVAGFETTNPRIRAGYERVRLDPVSYGTADEAVDWEFTFRADDGPRHAYGRYWRLYDTDYVVYASCATGAWPRIGEVIDTLIATASPH